MSVNSLDTPDAVQKSPSGQSSATLEDVSVEKCVEEIEADGFITLDLPGIGIPLPSLNNHA